MNLFKRKPVFGKSAILMSIFVALSSVKIELVGSLPLAEIFALICLPFLKLERLLKQYPDLRQALLAYALIFFGIVLADLINESAPEDYLRGWASMIMAAIVLIFFVAIFTRNPKSIFWFFGMSAFIAASSGDNLFDAELYAQNKNYIKTDIIQYLFPILIILAFHIEKINTKSAIIFLLTVGFSLMLLNARSAGLGVLIAAVFLYYRFVFEINARVLIYSTLMLVFFYAAYVGYVWITLKYGISGSTAEQLRYVANPYNPIELLMSGRSGLFVAIQAILDNPVIGWGSWGKDPDGRYWSLMSEYGGFSEIILDRSYIPSHSIILTGWLWGGLFGLAGTLWLVILILKSLNLVPYFPLGYRVMAYMLYSLMLWHLIFSPFGHLRSSIPLALSFIWAMSLIKNSKTSSF